MYGRPCAISVSGDRDVAPDSRTSPSQVHGVAYREFRETGLVLRTESCMHINHVLLVCPEPVV